MNDTEKTTYEIRHYTRNNYDFTTVCVRTMRTADVAELREGAVDNKAGYGTEDAAQRQLTRYGGMLECGIATTYETLIFGTRIDLTFEWQHYKSPGEPLSYCEVSLDLGRHFAEITAGHTFLRKFGNRVERARMRREKRTYRNSIGGHTFAGPDEVIAALARMRNSVQVEYDTTHEAWVATPARIYKASAA